MDTNPYQAPTTEVAVGERPADWPLLLALPAGFVAWYGLALVMPFLPLVPHEYFSFALALSAAPLLFLAALLIAWRCRGPVVAQWALLMAGVAIALLTKFSWPLALQMTSQAMIRPTFLVAAGVSLAVLASVRALRSRRRAAG
jgi:hypothetical protein